MSRVVVVGAGLGGLAAAARLAATGHEVTVVEAADEVGGKLGTRRRDGFTFDTGPSLLTMPHVFRELFEDTGGPLEEVLELERLDVACRYRFPDGTGLEVPGRVEDVPAALDAALGGGAGAQWSGFLRRAEQVWDVTHGPFLESPLGLPDLARLSRRLGDVRTVAPWSSLRALGRRHLTDPRLRQLLDRYATYTGSDPRLAPAALATVPWVEQAYGSWHVVGGLHRLARAVADRAVERGARLLTSEPVVEVMTDAGRACGVRTATGRRLRADVVVADADAAELYDHLVTGPGVARARRRLARTTPSLSGFVMLLALDDVPHPPAHHRVLFAEDYDAEFDAVFGRRRPPGPVPRPTVYVAAPEDPAMHPAGTARGWFVLVNAPRHDPEVGVDWDEPGLAERYADDVLAVMADRGFDVRPQVRWRELLTPADLARRTRTPGGSIYGSSSNGARAAFLRPANRSPVPGLFLVGGSAHPGGGLPLVTLSARIVADLVGPAVVRPGARQDAR